MTTLATSTKQRHLGIIRVSSNLELRHVKSVFLDFYVNNYPQFNSRYYSETSSIFQIRKIYVQNYFRSVTSDFLARGSLHKLILLANHAILYKYMFELFVKKLKFFLSKCHNSNYLHPVVQYKV